MPDRNGAEQLTFAGVVAARDLLHAHLPVTPLWTYPALNAVTGATLYVKHENVQPVGAFKVRGGLTLLAGTKPAHRGRGLITYSTGNHAQSLAYASAAYGTSCTVVMPATASTEKVRAVRSLGATVVLDGADMVGAQQRAEQLALDEGLRLINPGNTPALIAGAGTLYLEIFEAQPDLDAVIVPVGSGTGAAAAALVAAKLAPDCQVIAVQSAGAPAAHDSWRTQACVQRPIRTTADGLAVGRGYQTPQRLMRRLSAFHLVDDAQIRAAQRLLASHAHTLAEGAGAAALAAVITRPGDFAGKRVAVICSGGNASAAEIAALRDDAA